ncbi:MAG: flagellar motor protein MotB [Actinomycetota bacterium]|nr:flagellar motor protein MotB [Actinomycetota bacterium]
MGKHKKHEEEEHVNHERWLVSYADMMTLLMVLFIVLFAISQVDKKKFAQFQSGLPKSSGNQELPIAGSSGAIDGSDSAKPIKMFPDEQSLIEMQKIMAAAQAQQAAAQQEDASLRKAQRDIAGELARKGLQQQVSFRLEGRGLIVTIVTDAVLFQSGAAELAPRGRQVLDAVALSIRRVPNHVAVEGHTDSQPVRSGRFGSNWELSTARSTSVLRYLVEQRGAPATRMAAAGYADQRPIASNATAAGRAKNRRVEVVLLASHPETLIKR